MKTITIKDIAKKCGVGVSTVSRAINNHPDISEETRNMIMEVIKESNFVPNKSARNLKLLDTKTIAVLIKGIDNPFFQNMIKVFEEERELTVMLLVDVSASRDFGAVGEMKKSVMTEVAATLAFSAIQNNDKIGVIFFSDKIEKFIPPKKGKKHILYIIRELIDFHPESTGTNS